MRIVVKIEPQNEPGVLKARTVTDTGFFIGQPVRLSAGQETPFDIPDGFQLLLSAEPDVLKFERNF